ncbi:hypothetical protein GW777_07180 [Candidatus Peregrinibacteria bacterium]|uniref:CopG-like ribbon-helix-helix domain-containing protein n=1 Tax=Candidatus Roizmanbacteria bacterium CG22_combo_CG10-13_8_21_14_all_38_20 TaxID=1974862 RepID=A0A2H0BVM4_9BACT|nr:hypothetical protein [Candidatus Peregrinibacteria bacterium]PIP61681.1 MAG: hypothetical protein COW99_02830 [Candidatus Roizmanbacteria bacterium CG22_combo_CG10-13_8_21_14_all_38_20]PJC31387.1 MAG: hypothetical protein CO050_03375 [Candidatus Roizmanbacteria bacterium CG_4_9_14_0_2_um_filter_38_17]
MSNQNLTERRVQVNFPEELYQFIRKESFKQGSSISGVIRGVIKVHFGIKDSTSSQKNIDWGKFITKHVGAISGAANDSTTHDKWAHKTAIMHKNNLQ